MSNRLSMFEHVEEYLTYRRHLGYQLKVEGKLLRQFGTFVDESGDRGVLTIDIALQWVRLPEEADQLYLARRLEIVRCFARYLLITEPQTQVPPRGLLGSAHRRNTPHIYGEKDISALITAARRLRPERGLRSHTYATLIGLLASTGLRISEALNLAQGDVDVLRGILKIRETKFRKTRLVPLHTTAVAALKAYGEVRDRLAGNASGSFFVSPQGRTLPYSTVRSTFRGLCGSAGVTGSGRRHPRLHDLRHTFACRRVETWYDSNVNLNHAVSALSVYLGHAKVSDTYWYLTATPNLMARAAGRFESFVQWTLPEETDS